MESFFDLTDQARPEVRAEYAIARAELEMKASIRATAAAYVAIHDTLREAHDFPRIFVPDAFAQAADAAEFAVRGAVLDLAVRMNVAENTIRAYDHLVTTLLVRAPRVWSLFREGDISVANARVVSDFVALLPQELWILFEDAALAAAVLAPARFKSKMRATRERLHADAAERHRIAMDDRRIWVEHLADGMSELGLSSSTVDIARAKANIDHLALEMFGFEGETRTLAQLRADVAIDLLAGTLEAGTGAAITVGVIMPIHTLLGTSNEPGILHNIGPIDAVTARDLAGKSRTLYRILTDPITADIRNVESPKYRPDAEMNRNVTTRDPLCSTPGCGKPAENCELDHTIPWPDGPTRYDNLKPLCKNHHRVKHKTRWKSEQDTNGRTTWTSPTGFVREADPPPF